MCCSKFGRVCFLLCPLQGPGDHPWSAVLRGHRHVVPGLRHRRALPGVAAVPGGLGVRSGNCSGAFSGLGGPLFFLVGLDVVHSKSGLNPVFLCPADSLHLSDAGSAGGVSAELRDKDHQVLQQRPRLHLPPLETQGTAAENELRLLEQNRKCETDPGERFITERACLRLKHLHPLENTDLN